MPTTRSQTKPSDTNRVPDIDRTRSQGVPGPIIEWLDLDFSEMSLVSQMNWRNSLNEIQGTGRTGGNAKTTLYQYSDNVYSIYRVDYCIGKMIHAGFPMYPDPRQIHEVWMIYFPIYTLDSEKKRERQLPILLNFYGRDDEPSNPMSGILSHNIAWLSGVINYQGVQCQRLAWFMEWKSKEAEELYKTTVRWVREDKGKSCNPQLTLNMFVDDLKSLGMVG
ncbi:hypothetical protein N7463_002991 [Penicillium fimorum]|uniref:Uncharacterized protein n=1 Tax=Penicillium fimorum TaxID=1882269 RepID=A0A9X0C9G6_9EURO|nr:hypothetical protein N7463_002991 [Penicillium fimorum]